jgi:hypothetical protein
MPTNVTPRTAVGVAVNCTGTLAAAVTRLRVPNVMAAEAATASSVTHRPAKIRLFIVLFLSLPNYCFRLLTIR